MPKPLEDVENSCDSKDSDKPEVGIIKDLIIDQVLEDKEEDEAEPDYMEDGL